MLVVSEFHQLMLLFWPIGERFLWAGHLNEFSDEGLIIDIPCVMSQHRTGICNSINTNFNVETQFTK